MENREQIRKVDEERSEPETVSSGPVEPVPSGWTRRRIAIVSIAALLLIGLGVTAYLWRPWSNSASVHVHTESEGGYTCPMHPQIQEPDPGICPICFMDLVPVKNAAAAANDTTLDDLEVTPRGRLVADVSLVTVARRTFSQTLQVAASVDYNEATHRVVTARYGGRIERLFVDQTGQYVSRGAPLMEIYSPELVTAQKEYLVARETRAIPLPSGLDGGMKSSDEGWRRLVSASRKRLELLGMTAAQIESLERRGEMTYSTTVYSSASGVVVKRGVTEGAYVNEGTLLVELVDLSTVYVLANVYETDVHRVRPGMRMGVSGPALGGESMEGRVDYVYPTVDVSTRTVKVRGIFPNRGMTLKPGMYVTATILIPGADVLAVPVGAVLRTGRRDVVYVETGKNRFRPRDVKIGRRDGDYYEIIGGDLAAGDRVVAEGGFLLDSERQLTAPASAQ